MNYFAEETEPVEEENVEESSSDITVRAHEVIGGAASEVHFVEAIKQSRQIHELNVRVGTEGSERGNVSDGHFADDFDGGMVKVSDIVAKRAYQTAVAARNVSSLDKLQIGDICRETVVLQNTPTSAAMMISYDRAPEIEIIQHSSDKSDDKTPEMPKQISEGFLSSGVIPGEVLED